MFIFFGGKSAEGKGSGFKKEWKDAFDWSKNEYVKNGMEESNKDAINPLSNKTYRQELRDITNGLDTVDKCKNVTWPTKP